MRPLASRSSCRSVARGVVWLSVIALPELAACSHAPGPPPIEDKARRDVPIAICRKSLSGADTSDAGAPRLEAYWSVVIPAFHALGASLDPGASNCVGDKLSTNAGGGVAPGTQPIASDDLVLVSDEGGLQAAWLRSFRVNDRVATGPLALLRARPAELDVYALGDYRGSLRHSRFEFGRLGVVTVLVAHDDRCADVKVDTECESSHAFYVKAGGRLVLSATTPAQRIQYGTMKDIGRVQYRLATEPPVLDAHSITVKERLSVRDPADEEVRKIEGDRVFVLRNDGTLAPNQDSVWAQVPGAK
jgi:hypothetical protein